jgi:IclR family acetate operon transcriptional repressor
MQVADGPGRPGGVQSIGRAFAILEAIAGHDGGLGVSQLAEKTALPIPTIHRLCRTLVALSYLRQEPSREYALGPRLLLLAGSGASALGALARGHLVRLVDEVGETANLAMLDGDEIVYVAQVPSPHPMRMFTEVGRRVLPHSTAVGKALLASRDDTAVRALLGRTGMERYTENTITSPDAFMDAMRSVRELGYAVDDGEQELGVRCVAAALPGRQAIALSVSGPSVRMRDDVVTRAAPVLAEVARQLALELDLPR